MSPDEVIGRQGIGIFNSVNDRAWARFSAPVFELYPSQTALRWAHVTGPSIAGGVFHLTHRCHNRAFLLKFERDRNADRAKLREHLEQHQLWLLDYCVTCNHVHLLVEAAERAEISAWMQRVAGEFARAYNRRKGRTNAFWGDNYHATLVEEGTYLWRCLCYIELNMVRAGVG